MLVLAKQDVAHCCAIFLGHWVLKSQYQYQRDHLLVLAKQDNRDNQQQLHQATPSLGLTEFATIINQSINQYICIFCICIFCIWSVCICIFYLIWVCQYNRKMQHQLSISVFAFLVFLWIKILCVRIWLEFASTKAKDDQSSLPPPLAQEHLLNLYLACTQLIYLLDLYLYFYLLYFYQSTFCIPSTWNPTKHLNINVASPASVFAPMLPCVCFLVFLWINTFCI